MLAEQSFVSTGSMMYRPMKRQTGDGEVEGKETTNISVRDAW